MFFLLDDDDDDHVRIIPALLSHAHIPPPAFWSILSPLSAHMSSVPKLINAVVLLILLTALSDPEQYHLTSAELANDLDVMDDASK